jgi:hypothetical protein
MPVLGPRDVIIVRGAIEEAWSALQFAIDPNDVCKSAEFRNMIACSVLETHAHGERDGRILASTALASLPPLTSRWSDGHFF